MPAGRSGQRPGRDIYLICGAHLDPIWLWSLEDGLAAAEATFRIAADFCEHDRSFIFNHNESLLYEWVERVSPRLTERIERLVREGRWHCAGGAYLQPDLNNPSGEAHIRQFLYGRRHFARHYGSRATTAYNVDSFGQVEGYVQILRGCGFDSYLFTRGTTRSTKLPAGNFRWQDRSGLTVLARCAAEGYHTYRGTIDRKIDRVLDAYPRERATLLLWGVGNHGGGVSRNDLESLASYRKEHPEIRFIHATPEMYFRAVAVDSDSLPLVTEAPGYSSPGTYTNLQRLKQAVRACESQIGVVERLAAAQWWEHGTAYPGKELEEAWKDILLVDFHDVITGTCIRSGEEQAMARIQHCRVALEDLRFRCLCRMAAGEKRGGEGETPVFVWNPHAFEVSTIVEFEYTDWGNEHAVALGFERSTDLCAVVRRDGSIVPFQRMREESSTYSHVKRMAVAVRLPPFAYQRLDTGYVTRDRTRRFRRPPATARTLRLRSKFLSVVIDPATGLVASVKRPRSASSFVGANAFEPVVFRDNGGPWGVGARWRRPRGVRGTGQWGRPVGVFRLAGSDAAARVCKIARAAVPGSSDRVSLGVNVIEDGPLQTVLEAVFVWRRSYLVRRYRLSRVTDQFGFEDNLFWNEPDCCVKLRVPLGFAAESTVAETPYAACRYPVGEFHEDRSNQRWVAVVGAGAKGRYLGICSDGSFAHSADRAHLYLNLVRSPTYASFGNRTDTTFYTRRWLPRQDQGEHHTRFAVIPGVSFRESRMVREAAMLNTPPQWFVYFPGDASSLQINRNPFLKISPANVEVAAMKKAEGAEELIVRLRETSGVRSRAVLRVRGMRAPITTAIGPWRLKTLALRKGRRGKALVRVVNLVEEEPD